MYPERTGPTLDPTGDPRVDEAIAGLSALEETDLDQRPAVLQAVHDRLREILGERGDASPGEPGRGGRPDGRGEQGGRGEQRGRGEQGERGAGGGR